MARAARRRSPPWPRRRSSPPAGSGKFLTRWRASARRPGRAACACAPGPCGKRSRGIVTRWRGTTSGISLRKFLAPDRAQALEVVELAAVAAGHGAGEQDADRGGVLERPVADRQVADGGELPGHVARRRAHVGDPRVDPVAVGGEAGPQRRRELGELLVELGRRVVVAAGDDVVVDVVLAEDLGQVALGGAAEELELEEPVLGHRVAGAVPGVLVGGAVDRRHAVGVAGDPHAGPRRAAAGRLLEAVGLVAEGREQRQLVEQVRRARARGDPGRRDEAALARRQHVLGADDPGRGGRRGDEQGDERDEGGADHRPESRRARRPRGAGSPRPTTRW